MEAHMQVTFGLKKFAYGVQGVGTPLPEGQRRDILPHLTHIVKTFPHKNRRL
jgi:hypothetical protein